MKRQMCAGRIVHTWSCHCIPAESTDMPSLMGPQTSSRHGRPRGSFWKLYSYLCREPTKKPQNKQISKPKTKSTLRRQTPPILGEVRERGFSGVSGLHRARVQGCMAHAAQERNEGQIQEKRPGRQVQNLNVQLTNHSESNNPSFKKQTCSSVPCRSLRLAGKDPFWDGT